MFHYTIQDTAGAQSSATFTVTIHGANDLPHAVDDTGEHGRGRRADVVQGDRQRRADPDTGAANTITITGTVTASGPAGTNINNGDATAAVVGNQIEVTLGADFQTLTVSETATVTVPYTLTGNAGETDTANLAVTVNGANDGVDRQRRHRQHERGRRADARSTCARNDTLDVDHTAPNNISIGTVTASGPAGDGITGADVTTAVVGNQVQITLGADFQKLGGGESATIDVDYTLTATSRATPTPPRCR